MVATIILELATFAGRAILTYIVVEGSVYALRYVNEKLGQVVYQEQLVKPPEPPSMPTEQLNEKWKWLYTFWHEPRYFESEYPSVFITNWFGVFEPVYVNLHPQKGGRGYWVSVKDAVLGYDSGCPSMTFRELDAYVNAYTRWKQANPGDPLLLDLNGQNGIELVSVNNGVHFDFDKNGFAEKTAFINSNDAMLVIDKNNNGKIDNGNEVFSEYYIKNNGQLATNALDALADLDSNQDGVIDVNDEKFTDIKLLKGDGTLLTLAEAGIKSLNLTYTNTNIVDEEGNTKVKLASFTRTDNTTSEMSEFILHRNLFNTKPTEILDVPNELYKLPYIGGTGNVYSLQQAMVRDTSGELQTLLQEFVDEENPEIRNTLVEEILYKWTNSENINPDGRGNLFDARKLNVIEQFMGAYFQNNPESIPDANDTPNLEEIYLDIKNQIYAQLMNQSHLSYLFSLSFTYNMTTNSFDFNLNNAIGELQYQIDKNNDAGKLMLVEFTKSLKALGLYNNEVGTFFYDTFKYWGEEYQYIIDTAANNPIYGTNNYDTILGTEADDAIFGKNGNDSIIAGAGNDYLEGNLGNDTLIGGDGNDIIFDRDGDNLIDGGAGNDVLVGGIGDDTFIGGGGNDSMSGGAGDDTYIFSGGHDTISENIKYSYAHQVGGRDTLVFDNISVNNVTFSATTDGSIIASINNSTDTITLLEQNNQNFQIENFVFSDAAITLNDIITNLSINGTSGADVISGTMFSESIFGAEGADYINAGEGNNYIEGGVGNDTLVGGSGDDVYAFNSGDGQDTISDSAGYDTIKFGVGIALNNFDVTSDGISVSISLKDGNGDPTGDSITVYNGINGTNRFEKLEFSDGTLVSWQEILDMLPPVAPPDPLWQGDEYDNNLVGAELSDSIVAEAGNDTLYGYAADDTLLGGTGNDLLYGGTGNDRYIFNIGDGQDTILDYDHANNWTDAGTSDRIVFGAGITSDDILVTATGNDLIITLLDSYGQPTTDKITITNGLYSLNKIENYEFADSTVLTYEQILAMIPATEGTSGNDSLTGSVLNDTILGNAGDDTIQGNSGNDSIEGGAGSDIIYASDGNDTISGGAGNDSLYGGMSNDTYIFNTGDGQDTILDYDMGNNTTDAGTSDRIKFGAGITSDDILVTATGNDLVITLLDSNGDPTTDKITITNGIASSLNKIEYYEFSDSTVLTYEQILAMIPIVQGDENNNTIIGSVLGDTLSGGAGNDNIQGLDGNDSLLGGADNDTISAGLGNDTLSGGTGNDSLYGEHGDDTYLYNVGDAQDTIYDYHGYENWGWHDADAGTSDRIKFGVGITPDKLLVTGTAWDMTITRLDNNNQPTTDKIIIRNGLYDFNKIESYEFADSTVLTLAEMIALIPEIEGTEGNDSILGSYLIDTILGNAGDDTIQSYDGNDSISGGAGNDLITSGGGNSVINGDAGNDSISAGTGNDTLSGGTGKILKLPNKSLTQAA